MAKKLEAWGGKSGKRCYLAKEHLSSEDSEYAQRSLERAQVCPTLKVQGRAEAPPPAALVSENHQTPYRYRHRRNQKNFVSQSRKISIASARENLASPKKTWLLPAKQTRSLWLCSPLVHPCISGRNWFVAETFFQWFSKIVSASSQKIFEFWKDVQDWVFIETEI